MRFTKMEGLGNDYVYVNCFREKVYDPEILARLVSDRHRGIGGDGLILIGPSARADFNMDIYNADGSRAEMCGNGIRCLGKYVYDHGMTEKTEYCGDTGGYKTAQMHSAGWKSGCGVCGYGQTGYRCGCRDGCSA